MSLRRVHRTWETLAKSDPLWAIASRPDKKGNLWEPEEFFRTGEEQVRALFEELDGRGHGPRRGRALDFGCGVGRLTQALAGRFDRVDGVDVSTRMVELARGHNRHGERCRYHASAAESLPFEAGCFDFVLSLITLQHMPATLASGYIREFVRVLAPGGIARFQMTAEPVERDGASSAIRRLVKSILPRSALGWIRSWRAGLAAERGYEMHGIARTSMERLIGDAGGELLLTDADRLAGSEWTSFSYTVRKP